MDNRISSGTQAAAAVATIENRSNEVKDYKRLISDVCSIFREVTQYEADPLREAVPIIHFARNHHWANFEFRLIIEYSFIHDAWLLEAPDRMNIRTMFNLKNEQRLLDLLVGLKGQKKLEEKRAERRLLQKTSPHLFTVNCQWSNWKGKSWRKSHKIQKDSIHCNRCIEEFFPLEILFNPAEAYKHWKDKDSEKASYAHMLMKWPDENVRRFVERTHQERVRIYEEHGINVAKNSGDILEMLSGK